MAPRIINISADELRRMFAAPETAAPTGPSMGEVQNLLQAIQGRAAKEKEQQLKLQELEANIAAEEQKLKDQQLLASEAGFQASEQARQQAQADIDPNQPGPEIGPITPEANIGIERAGQLAEAQFRQGASDAADLKGRDIQQKDLILPDGTRMSAQLFETIPSKKYGTPTTWFDLAGNEIDPKTLAGAVFAVAPSIVIDQFGNPNITERVGPRRAYAVQTPAQDLAAGKGEAFEGGLNALMVKAPKVYKNVEEAYKKAFPENNKMLEVSVTGASAAAAVKSVLAAEGDDISEVGLQSLGFHLARMSGSNSQLSDREREIFEAPLALGSKIKNTGYKLIAGDLSPKMRKDLMNLANILENKSYQQGEKIISGVRKRARAKAGPLWNAQLDSEFPTMEEHVVSSEDMSKRGSSKREDLKARIRQRMKGAQ